MRPEDKAKESQRRALTHSGEKKFKVVGTEVHCTNCNAVVGTVHNDRNLLSGHSIMVNRAAIRCYMCLERHVWTPLDARVSEVMK